MKARIAGCSTASALLRQDAVHLNSIVGANADRKSADKTGRNRPHFTRAKGVGQAGLWQRQPDFGEPPLNDNANGRFVDRTGFSPAMRKGDSACPFARKEPRLRKAREAGDPYGNRTRVSAVRGPRPDR